MNLTGITKKVMRIARRLLFPDGRIVFEGKRDDDAGTYALSVTLTDYWYARRTRALEMVLQESMPNDVIDFYVADGVGITDDNFESFERVTTNGRRYDILGAQQPLGQPRLWRLRCHPVGKPV